MPGEQSSGVLINANLQTCSLSSSGQPCEVVHDQPTTGEGAGGHIDGWEELHA